MGVSVERTLDLGICFEVLMNPVIFDAISEDGMTPNQLKVDVVNDFWLAIFNEELIGVVQFKQMFNKTWDSHIHILPEKRDFSVEAGHRILDWCSEHMKGHLLFTTIPEFCGNVKHYLAKFDFNEVGILEGAWFKHGKQHNMTIMTKRVE